MGNVFISYSRKNQPIAFKLAEACKAHKLDIWIDKEGIEPTVDWWQKIEKGIESADSILFLLSPDSIVSEVCQREIRHAVRNGKRLIPVVVSKTPGAMQNDGIETFLLSIKMLYFIYAGFLTG